MKKTALVTGGCSGIGYAVVEKFQEEQWRIVVLDKAPFPKELMGKDCFYYQTDLENEEEI